MANNLAALKTTGFERFHEVLAQQTEGSARACRVITTDTKNLDLGMSFGTGLYAAAGTGDLAATDIISDSAVLASLNWEKKERIRWQDQLDNPDLAMQRVALMANRGAASLRNIVSTGITGLFTLAHPLAGGPTGVLAGTKFIDATIEFNNAAGTQANLLAASALSYATFATARQVLGQYFGQDGVVLGLGENVRLVTGITHQDVGREIVQSSVSSAAMQSNVAGQAIDELIVIPGLTSKWFVIDSTTNPLVLHVRKMPQINISETTDGVFIELTATMTATFGVMPSEAGIVGSNF